MAEVNLPIGRRKNSPAVARLKRIGENLDALAHELIKVGYLERNVAQKKDVDEIQELADKALESLYGVRDGIAEKGGQSVAKGYVKK
ncbi:hypothetical protein [Saccharopolyspora sp. NPDC002686]|uniref:hypothetical protein n=1 Tax=Saccharopolyspora sp. NPDC002686 TaxID=3154541 RepID=UPI00332502F7